MIPHQKRHLAHQTGMIELAEARRAEHLVHAAAELLVHVDLTIVNNDKYILAGQTPVPEPDLLRWAKWFETCERRIRLTRVGHYHVSTVFLGLDHRFYGDGPPILFETMIFCETGEPNNYQTRCSTWLEAEQQHDAAVAEIRQQWDDIEQLYPSPLVESKP